MGIGADVVSPYFPHQAGQQLDFGGAEVRLLVPEGGNQQERRKNESLVMKFVYQFLRGLPQPMS
jgi:hypothetical protein